MYTRDMTTINDFDWCVVVYENFRIAITERKEKVIALKKLGIKDRKSRCISGCTIMLLVSIYLYFFFIGSFLFIY